MSSGIHERRVYRKGAVILREGDTGDLAFLIQSGSVEVFTHQGEKDVVLAHLKTGDIFGEMALLTDEPRAASVRAAEETSLVLIERGLFRQKLEKTDPTIKAILQMLAQRITSSNKAVSSKKTGVEGFIETVRSAYVDTQKSMPLGQQAAFEAEVKFKLEQFIAAASAFAERIKG